MAIREPIILDTTGFREGLSEAHQETIKYARKQEQVYKQQQKELRAIGEELDRLHVARKQANDPKEAQRYTDAIQKLEKDQRQLRKETEKYESAAKQTSGTVTGSFKKMGKAAKKWIAGVMVGALLGIGEVLRRISRDQIEFEKRMNESLAIQGAVTMEQRNRMEQAARSISSELNMAADEVAQGYFYLASAGLSVEQQIANLPQVAKFAKAGMFDLAAATDLATDAQSALGLTVEDTAQNQENLIRVTDVLTKANTESNATIEQFSQALTNKAGTRLRQFNKDVEEGVAVLAAYADQGIKGEQAGERLNILYRELARTYRENTEAFKEFGIQVFDQNGEMRNMAAIIGEVEAAFEGMSSQERDATLAKLGFNSESQDSINALIGMSQEISDYEASLKDAAGTTQEVADNQMKDLQERAGSLWKSFKNAFGPATGSMMDTIINKLEDMAKGVSRLIEKTQSPAEELLNILRRVGADAERIQELEIQVALQDAKELRDQLEEQVFDFTVPIAIRRDPDTMMLQVLGDSGRHVGEEYARSILEGFQSRLENLPKSIDKAMERGDKGRANRLRDEARALEDSIGKLQQYLRLRENMAETEQAIQDLQSSEEDSPLPSPSDEDTQKTKEWVRANKKAVDVARTANKIFKEDIDVSMDFEDPAITAAVANLEMYNNELTKLRNQLQVGEIDQEQFAQKAEEAAQRYLSELEKLYLRFKEMGALTPEIDAAFDKAFSNIREGIEDTKETTDEANESVSEISSTFEDIADAVDSIINVADAFGEIDEEAKNALRGVSDVLRALGKIERMRKSNQSFGALDYALPGIGMVTGLLSMAGGVFGAQGNDQARQEAIELRNSIEKLRRAVEDNTEAFLEQGTIGGDISQEDIDKAGNLIDELTEPYTGGPRGGRGTNRTGRIYDTTRSEALSIFSQLEETFPELYEGIEEQFRNYLEQGFSVDEAIKMIMGDYGQVLETVKEQTGEYGQSIAGAAEIFSDQIKFGGKTIEEAFDMAAEHILNNVATMEELDQKAINLIEEAKALDLSTEEGQQRLREIVEILFNNPQWRGNLTKDEWENMLDLWLNAADQAESATGSEASEWSRSVQAARTITDVQANEMVFLLEMIEQWTRDTAAALGSETAITVNETGIPSFNIPIPLPVEITEPIEPTVVNSVNKAGNDVNNDISIQVTGNGETSMTDQDIDRLTDQIGRALKREIRGRKY